MHLRPSAAQRVRALGGGKLFLVIDEAWASVLPATRPAAARAS